MSMDLNKKEDIIKIQNKTIVRGTPIHAAPEIWQKSEYTKAADIYAFALTVFEIMTNDKPSKNVNGIFNIIREVSILNNRPKFVYPIPSRYKKLIEGCWSNKPNNRLSLDQIIFALKNDNDFISQADVDKDEYLNFIDLVEQRKKSFELKLEFEKFHKNDEKVKIKTRDISVKIIKKI